MSFIIYYCLSENIRQSFCSCCMISVLHENARTFVNESEWKDIARCRSRLTWSEDEVDLIGYIVREWEAKEENELLLNF